MKRNSIYLSREEAFQVGYTIAKVVKNLKEIKCGYKIEGTDIYYSKEEIELITKVYDKLNIMTTWEEMQF